MMQNELKKCGITIKPVPFDKQPTSDSLKRLDNEISSKRVVTKADTLHEFEEWLKNQIVGIDNHGTSSKNQILVVRQDKWSDAVEVYLKETEKE